MNRPRRGLPLAAVACALALAASAEAQVPAIRIGYVPQPSAGTVSLTLNLWMSDCGSDVACPLFNAGLPLSGPANDAAAVMAAIDAAMAGARCSGFPSYPIFEAPITVLGARAAEVRHEYRVRADAPMPSIISSSILFDHGAMSFALVAPCVPYGPAAWTGPYYVAIVELPSAAGSFRIACTGRPDVTAPADPVMTLQSIADGLITEARAQGIDATPYGTATVGFNQRRFNQDIPGIEYAGMSDLTPIQTQIGNDLWIWVPTRTSTWGELKAAYR